MEKITTPWDWQWNHLTALDVCTTDLVPLTSDSRTRAKVSDKYILIGEKSGLLYRKGNTSENDLWEPLNHTESQVGFI